MCFIHVYFKSIPYNFHKLSGVQHEVTDGVITGTE